MPESKILLSGVKPTGTPHIGNYFGAMKQFVELQNKYESSFFIANYHALTNIVANNGEQRRGLEKNTFDIAVTYLAIGLDPRKTTLFLQSDVPQVTELAWIFNCLTTVPYLMRAHAYKDAITNGKEPNVGLFDYPLLMAADILIQDADVVPVGQDQKQHVEIARDTAEKFNRIFGEVFRLPKSLILENVATVPGIDGRKMSKSYGNTISLFATDEEIEKSVMSIVTDSSNERPENVYAIHALFKDKEFLDNLYEENKGKYKILKEVLIDDLKNFVRPMRDKKQDLETDKKMVLNVLRQGGQVARERAEKKMKEVREKIGLQIL
ncbi:MAG: tryptophan--tRNA ligase [Patescibacteria group bacterium]